MNKHPFVPARIEEWAYWITEREKIRVARENLKRAPWTKDPVMANTRWCNVRRMDDKVSKWLVDNWYPELGTTNDKTVLTAALLARMVNRPETLERLTNGKRFSKFDHDRFHRVMQNIQDDGLPIFTGVYIINGASGGPKHTQVLNCIDEAVGKMNPAARQYIQPESMEDTANMLHSIRGVGSFIAGQVVADLRWVMGDVDAGWWADRMSWAPPGPGSSRGMRYLLGGDPESGRGNDFKKSEFVPYLRQLISVAREHKKVAPVFAERKLEAHDIQNTLCELSKLVRVRNGGRAKNGYSACAALQRELGI